MNREIIFRGKRVDGEWVEGYYVKINTDRSIDVFYDEIFSGEMSSDNSGRVDFKRNIVIKETVGQYTGLNDSTGKMIFEGDIVQYKNSIEQAKGLVLLKDAGFISNGLTLQNQMERCISFNVKKSLKLLETVLTTRNCWR